MQATPNGAPDGERSARGLEMRMTSLPPEFLERLRDLEASYLREVDPVRQSGFGGGEQRWRTERELILDAVTGDGDLLDVGCANGYLLECLVKWGHERGIRLTPHGLDCGANLVALAKARLPEFASHFWLGNSWDWVPTHPFRYVYSLYDCVPEGMLLAYIRRLAALYVAVGGTLILGAYGSMTRHEPARDITADIAAAGLVVSGCSSRGELPVSRVAWVRIEQVAQADEPSASRRVREKQASAPLPPPAA
jgi:hypothetical protein